MRPKVILVSILAMTLAAFAVQSARAQHNEHHPQGQAAQDQSKPGMMGGDMVGQNMTEMMSKMNGNQQEMFRLMEKLMASLKSIQDEKDPAALKSKLAEHQALLNQMHERMTQQGRMMGEMSEMSGMSDMMMKNCSRMGGNAGLQIVAGTIKAFSPRSITVETMGMDRKTVSVVLAPSTKFTEDGKETSVRGLKMGDRVIVSVKLNGDKLEATQVIFGQMLQQHMDMHHK